MNNFDSAKLWKTLPSWFMLMYAAYLIDEGMLIKWYKTNKFTRALYNMEYQHLKSFSYLRNTYTVFGTFPNSFMMNSLIIDVPEGMATNLVYIFEDFLSTTKVSFTDVMSSVFLRSSHLASLTRNLKVYLVLNIISTLYFIYPMQERTRILMMSYVSTSRLYEGTIYFIMFVATWDKIQTAFKEKSILSTLQQIFHKILQALTTHLSSYFPPKTFHFQFLTWIKPVETLSAVSQSMGAKLTGMTPFISKLASLW